MSSATGKTIRLNRLIQKETNTSIICAIDHGLTSPLFLSGLYDTEKRVQEAIAGGANVLMLGRGISKRAAVHFTRETSLAFMLTASASMRPAGAVITAIEDVDSACTIGADAVVVYVALAGENEPEVITYVSGVAARCDDLGMPFIAEAEYPNAYQSLNEMSNAYGADYLKRNARICAELGADIVKVNWSGDAESFGDIIKAAGKPVVLAGGSRISDTELLERMEQARNVGAIGCSVGRNIFQHQNPQAMTKAICRVFRERWTARHALQELQETLNS